MLYTINCSVPKKADNCSICNLERMAIAEAGRVKMVNIKKELTSIYPQFRSCFFKFINFRCKFFMFIYQPKICLLLLLLYVFYLLVLFNFNRFYKSVFY